MEIFITRLRRTMPKYHHGEAIGFKYKVRPVGFWRRWTPVRFVPYFNGDVIKLHISLKPQIANQAWQTGILQISPDVQVSGISDPLEKALHSSDTVFCFVPRHEWPAGLNTAPKYDFPIGKWWSDSIPLKGGKEVVEETSIECNLFLQNLDNGNWCQTVPFRVADIEIVPRGPFITQVLMWVVGLGLSFMFGWLLIVMS